MGLPVIVQAQHDQVLFGMTLADMPFFNVVNDDIQAWNTANAANPLAFSEQIEKPFWWYRRTLELRLRAFVQPETQQLCARHLEQHPRSYTRGNQCRRYFRVKAQREKFVFA